MRARVRADFRVHLDEEGPQQRTLTAGKEYFVIGVLHDDLQVVDDAGEPILFPKSLFEVSDSSVPTGWQFCDYGEGDYYLQPAIVARPGFFEDWHGSDGNRTVQTAARRALRTELVRMANEAQPEDKVVIDDALSRLAPDVAPRANPR